MGGLGTSIGNGRVRRLAALAAVLTLVALTWATATASARFTDHEAKVSVRVAHGFWHSLAPAVVDRAGYHCNTGNVVLDWLRNLGSAMALADLFGCRQQAPTIELERRTIRGLSDVGACGIITHEFGHLLGFAHSSAHRNVMSGAHSRGATPPTRATWERAWHHCRGV